MTLKMSCRAAREARIVMGDIQCRQCNAPVQGLICDFCGTLTGQMEGAASQREALDKYHQLLQKHDPPAQIKLLKNGFFPDYPELLVEGGLRCLPLIDVNKQDEVSAAATQRLEGITTKLKVLASDVKSERAVQEFDAKVDAFRTAGKRDEKLGFILFIVIPGLLLLGCVLFFWLISMNGS